MVSKNSDKISPRQLRRMLVDPRVDDSELIPLLQWEESSLNSVEPLIRANPETVDTTTMVNDGLLALVNRLARERRHLQYRLKVNNPLFTGQKIVSEGDSWFQFPFILADVVDNLFKPFDELNSYAVYSLGAAGDLLENIVDADEMTQAIESENPEVFMISGGGNDLVADGNLANLLHPFEEGREARDYPNQAFEQFLQETVQLYRGLFLRLLSRFSDLKIICHGYDYPIPNHGASLGLPMASLNITDAKLQKEIVKVVIDRFNEVQINLIQNVEFGGRVFHVDCRGVVGDENWTDELHPNNRGFKAVAELFDLKIQNITNPLRAV
jgi:hypothetical protein